ncbi:F0F1 ATP synthase subunit delta [Gynuella sunshinyii]|uniref:ATP synthase subunit delta n=1 Tax=Gynuella sunshinyii YC6258 TaxID=1445510 RepID=A0A0C5VE62_9GAMM|nr:F0F1 ATP synthase subunit delta [Gynuella sunshinyii]AJQ92797.1 F0F1-type ATP synthase, delta subunit (mitochondrial oligomycin sensitivity protein) [Gynuella sunshinyii YC6258]
MAEVNTLARPYAKAAFEAAQAAKTLEQWSESLATLSAVTQQEKVLELISNPSLTASQKAQVIQGVCGEETKVISTLITTLAENRRLELCPGIAALFEEFKAELEKSVEVQVTSAFELTADQEKSLTEKLTTKLGRDVKLVTSVDNSIIGGVIIRTNDMVIDGSVTGKLAKLAEAMYS